MAELDLKNLILPEKTVSFEFPECPGFVLDLTFLGKDEMAKLQERCTIKKLDPRSRRVYPQLDEEKFLDEYVRATIKGWKGFKFKYLTTFVLTSDVSDYDDDDTIRYSHENAMELIKSSTLFDGWLSDITTDLTNFTKSSSKKKEKTLKDTSSHKEQAA